MNIDEQVRILCVDDEKNVLRTLQRLFLDNDYEILIATSGDDGLEILRNEDIIQIVISDYRMPGMNGVDFLKEVCQHWPDTVRIVLSGYADTAAIVGAINEGQIYKFIPKPWNDDELKVTISIAIERYYLHKKNIQFAEELKKKNKELQMMNNNLEKLVAERTSELIFQNKVLKRSQNILDSLPDVVLGIDSDGLIVQCNQKGMELLGENNSNIVGMDRRIALSKEINSFIDSVIENNTFIDHISIGNGNVRVRGVFMKYPDGQEGIVLIFDMENKDG